MVRTDHLPVQLRGQTVLAHAPHPHQVITVQQVIALIKHSWRRRQDALEMVAKRVNSASSQNHYNSFTSRVNITMRKEESEDANDF
ncbi:hypothetical protein DPMN_062084 [Dreissena polymorpha]|uniref:Uncharacterized protein n=1 Tax=Dreissena polymorpha TaxID=45954 RepID=A0A9D4HHS5_DREPO|nr:hypothetical protein DPMN_062084 [Dreissena polymorpha]